MTGLPRNWNSFPLGVGGPWSTWGNPEPAPGTVYLDQDGSMWRKESSDLEGWVRVYGQRPRPTTPVPREDDITAYRQWPQVLVARLLSAGFTFERACTIAETQLGRLRKGDHPRDVLGGWLFCAGAYIPDALAKTLDRMFVETNFTNVDDEWAWKHLFEAAVYSLPPL